MNDKKTAQSPEQTAKSLSALAEKLEEMDRAEGVFGEPVDNGLSDEYLEEVAGGIPPTPSVGVITCCVCRKSVDPTRTYDNCPNYQPNESCPYYFKGR